MRNLITICKRNHFIGIVLFVFATFFFMSPVTSEASNETQLGDQLLIEGKEHEHVLELQELLIERGYISDDVSEGKYDSATREAVLEFQEDAGISIDGIAGPQTIGALKVLEKGDEGKAVFALQDSLNRLGYYDYKVDGVFGPITYDAVKGFQKAEGIVVDGLAGPQTYGALQKGATMSGNSETITSSNSSSTEETVEETVQETTNETSEASSTDEETETTEAVESSSDEEDTATEPNDSSSNENTDTDSSSNEDTTTTSAESSEDTTTATSRSSSGGKTMNVEATAYTAYCNGCSGITATGLDLRNNPGKKVIAVDPSVIPLGSRVEVEGYGIAIAGDTGGAIKGNKIDLFMPSRDDALSFGRRNLQITVLE